MQAESPDVKKYGLSSQFFSPGRDLWNDQSHLVDLSMLERINAVSCPPSSFQQNPEQLSRSFYFISFYSQLGQLNDMPRKTSTSLFYALFFSSSHSFSLLSFFPPQRYLFIRWTSIAESFFLYLYVGRSSTLSLSLTFSTLLVSNSTSCALPITF